MAYFCVDKFKGHCSICTVMTIRIEILKNTASHQMTMIYSRASYKRIRNHFILKSSLPFCVGVVFIEKLNEYDIDLGFDIDPLIKIDRFLKALWNFVWEIHRFLFSIITLTVHFTHQLKCVHKTNMKTAKNHLIHAFWWSWFCAFGKVASWRGY